MSILLLMLVIVPVLGALACALFSPSTVKGWAFSVSLGTAVIAIVLASSFNYRQDVFALNANGRPAVTPFQRTGASDQFQMPLPGTSHDERFSVPDVGFEFHLGMDAITLMLVLLTAVLMPPALLASFASIKDRQKEYYAWMLVLLAAMNGVFLARDLLLFYLFFELTLIPMFFIIGIWGGPERRFAAGKFFLFTFGGSVFTLAAILYAGTRAGTFDISGPNNLIAHIQLEFSATERWWILLGLLAGFAVKVPLFPVHTWLPLAHTEAPTAGSVILAGVLLKLGTYGLLRLAIPIGFVGASGVIFPRLLAFLAFLCVVGILYGALVAWVQQDIKKLVAYSSVSHLGFCVLGLLALNDIGMQGSVLYMVNHGLSTGAMFLVIGMIYDRVHTRDINQLSGLARRMPRLAFFFVFFVLSSIGLPGLNGFVSEFLTVLGAFTSPTLGTVWFGVFAAIGVILGALYMLHMTARVIFGPLKYPGYGEPPRDVPLLGHGQETDPGGHHAPLSDIGAREIGLLIPIALAVLVLGIRPTFVTGPIEGPITLLRNPLGAAPAAAQVVPAPGLDRLIQAEAGNAPLAAPRRVDASGPVETAPSVAAVVAAIAGSPVANSSAAVEK